MSLETMTAAQKSIYESDAPGLMVTAPAGCGKTEVLALRVLGLIERNLVCEPRKILVVTFTNKARDNIQSRLLRYLPQEKLRRFVYIANFHGLAARLISAHGAIDGIDGSWVLPSYDWVAEFRRDHNIGWSAYEEASGQLQTLKQRGLSDTETISELEGMNAHIALQIEHERVKNKQLTYDDLPRIAERLLSDERVRRLYANHFAYVIVDEYQDLTPQQLRIVQSIGMRRTTYAGDLAQGIYGFAGARPNETHAAIAAECDVKFELDESWRSSPEVLRMVNAFAPHIGGVELRAAITDGWPGGGLAGALSFASSYAEGEWIAKVCAEIIGRFPERRIGVFTRTQKRRRAVEEALAGASLQFVRWEDGVFEREIAAALRKLCVPVIVEEARRVDRPMEYLDSAAGRVDFQDPELRAGWKNALEWFCDACSQGSSASAIRERVKAGERSYADSPGIHCLNAHTGKGQQFDWVFIAGCEEGVTPFFKAESHDELLEEMRVFSVMLSRARIGVVATCATTVHDYDKGRDWSNRRQSPYFCLMRRAGALGCVSEVETWFERAVQEL